MVSLFVRGVGIMKIKIMYPKLYYFSLIEMSYQEHGALTNRKHEIGISLLGFSIYIGFGEYNDD